jgi:hypothetical protein
MALDPATLQALSRAVAQPSVANPYANGLNVSGAGGTGNWGVSYDPTFGTLAANTGFGEAPIYTPSQFSALLGKLPSNETFGNGPNQASVTANPDAPKSNGPGSQAQYAASFAPSAGSPLVVNTGGGGGSSFLNAPGGQTIQYGLDPKTGYEVPISARGSAPGTSDIWDSIVPAVLGTAALGGAGALAAGAGAAGAGAAGADVASSIADPTLGFISGAGAPGELAGGIDLGAVAPLGAGGAAAGAGGMVLDNSALINDIANTAAGNVAPQLQADLSAGAAAGDAGITADIGGGSGLGSALRSLASNKNLLGALSKVIGGLAGGGTATIGGGTNAAGGTGSAGAPGSYGGGTAGGIAPLSAGTPTGVQPTQHVNPISYQALGQSPTSNPMLSLALREMLGQQNG